MANFELDPIFVKALTLLHSKNRESDEQLRQMVDDVLAATQDKSGTDRKNTDSKSQGTSSKSSAASKKESSISSRSSEQRKEPEKRGAEKFKPETTEPSREAKKPKLDETVSKPKKYESTFLRDDLVDEDDSTEKTEDSTTDADDFAMEMGLACVLCRQLDVSSGNQLVECQECHNLYHQKCHKPTLSDADVNDPRVVWYCNRCSRNMKKMASKQKSKSSMSSSSKDSKKNEEPVLLFKRSESSMATSKNSAPGPSSTSHQPLVGLASLAANLSGKQSGTKVAPSILSSKAHSTSSMKTSTSTVASKSAISAPIRQGMTSSSSSKPSPVIQPPPSKPVSLQTGKSGTTSRTSSATSTANAMKRLQMMKKKAAKR
ncbi:integrator complex subunit 12-like isoform X1 [Glandiceps talaboti]